MKYRTEQDCTGQAYQVRHDGIHRHSGVGRNPGQGPGIQRDGGFTLPITFHSLLSLTPPPLFNSPFVFGSSLLALLLIIAFEVAFDESREIAIKHCVYISRFYVCAMVFYHLVGMKNIRPNLASPLNFL